MKKSNYYEKAKNIADENKKKIVITCILLPLVVGFIMYYAPMFMPAIPPSISEFSVSRYARCCVNREKNQIPLMGTLRPSYADFSIENLGESEIVIDEIHFEVINYQKYDSLNTFAMSAKGGETEYLHYSTIINSDKMMYLCDYVDEDEVLHEYDIDSKYVKISGKSLEKFIIAFKTKESGLYTARAVIDYTQRGIHKKLESSPERFVVVLENEFPDIY